MSDPAVQKIGRGLDELERAKAQLPNARLAKIASAPTTPPEIQAYAARFKQRRDRIRAIHVADNEHLEQRKLEINRTVAGLGLNKTEQMWVKEIGKQHTYRKYGIVLYVLAGILAVCSYMKGSRDLLAMALVLYLSAALLQSSSQALGGIAKLKERCRG